MASSTKGKISRLLHLTYTRSGQMRKEDIKVLSTAGSTVDILCRWASLWFIISNWDLRILLHSALI